MASTVIVDASSSNGTIEYSLWNSDGDTILQDWQTSNEFEGVEDGDYTVKVRDEPGCTAEQTVTV